MAEVAELLPPRSLHEQRSPPRKRKRSFSVSKKISGIPKVRGERGEKPRSRFGTEEALK